MSRTLQLTFETAAGKTSMLTVDEPRSDITSEQIQAAMQQIIATGAFEVDGSPLSASKSARIVERTVTEFTTA
ncbi:hypothetical protein NCCP2222_35140 [Sporosarcina sp. NCCP-2222]|uniref:DUF2922 domain-containing protein n=1 Tax=Sporosarcina sp. NCCP-2222 TaxID=2935073 RepID=UPI00208929CD|nr:DUF2922 domain-containing protein [Sporosarcina sp. NCCP-2222]GKV57567.1 hypothetical protein NCCP2222_35140 [Sporosarcina sp. NCCP-2222]